MLAILLLSFVVAVALGLAIALYVSRAVKKGVIFAESLGNGDLSIEMEDLKSRDELGVLVTSLNEAREKIKYTINRITEESNSIASSSQELSATMQQINSTFEGISNNNMSSVDNIQEVNAATEELTATVEEVNAGITQLASSSTEGNRESANIKERARTIKIQGQNSKKRAESLLSENQREILKAIEDGKVVNEISVIAE